MALVGHVTVGQAHGAAETDFKIDLPEAYVFVANASEHHDPAGGAWNLNCQVFVFPNRAMRDLCTPARSFEAGAFWLSLPHSAEAVTSRRPVDLAYELLAALPAVAPEVSALALAALVREREAARRAAADEPPDPSLELSDEDKAAVRAVVDHPLYRFGILAWQVASDETGASGEA